MAVSPHYEDSSKYGNYPAVQNNEDEDEHKYSCSFCGESALQKCSGCGAKYCSVECHKNTFKKIKKNAIPAECVCANIIHNIDDYLKKLLTATAENAKLVSDQERLTADNDILFSRNEELLADNKKLNSENEEMRSFFEEVYPMIINLRKYNAMLKILYAKALRQL